MHPRNNRRDFLKKLALSGAAVGAAGTVKAEAAPECCATAKVQYRDLGKTGKKVGMLALGLGSVFTRGHEKDPEATEKILQRALDYGINYWDTATGYGPSQKMLGPMVEKNRDKIFLVTKSGDRSYDGMKRDLEKSLKQMRTDYIDLYHIHSLKPDQDVDLTAIEKGALKALLEAKEEGIVKHIGATGHSGAAILKQAVEEWPMEVVMTVLPIDRPDNGAYEDIFIPAARERNVAVVAMKTNRHARNSDLPGVQLVRYALSLDGVSTAVVGLDSMAHLDENAAMCASFSPMTKDEMATLSTQARGDLAALGPAPWERKGYEDQVLV